MLQNYWLIQNHLAMKWKSFRFRLWVISPCSYIFLRHYNYLCKLDVQDPSETCLFKIFKFHNLLYLFSNIFLHWGTTEWLNSALLHIPEIPTAIIVSWIRAYCIASRFSSKHIRVHLYLDFNHRRNLKILAIINMHRPSNASIIGKTDIQLFQFNRCWWIQSVGNILSHSCQSIQFVSWGNFPNLHAPFWLYFSACWKNNDLKTSELWKTSKDNHFSAKTHWHCIIMN